jgi:hypothetical protein
MGKGTLQRASRSVIGQSVTTYVSSFSLTAFRSYDHAQLEMAPGCVMLTGHVKSTPLRLASLVTLPRFAGEGSKNAVQSPLPQSGGGLGRGATLL